MILWGASKGGVSETTHKPHAFPQLCVWRVFIWPKPQSASTGDATLPRPASPHSWKTAIPARCPAYGVVCTCSVIATTSAYMSKEGVIVMGIAG